MTEFFSIPAEQGVLGSIMLASLQQDAGLVEDIMGQLSSVDFHHPDHAALFEAMNDCNERSMPIDPVTVDAVQRRLPSGNGTLAYAADLTKNTPSLASWKTYVKHVKDWSVLRRILAVHDVAVEMVSAGEPTADVIAAAQQAMADLRNLDGEHKEFKRLDQWMGDAAEMVDQKHQGLSPKWPSTGLSSLDKLVRGIRPKKVTVIAGLPASGKTTLALQIAQHGAVKERKPWLVFSIEMPGEELGLRAIASLGGINLARLDEPEDMDDDDWAKLSGSVAIALDAPLFVCDDPVQTPATIRATARRCEREHGLAGIVVDYLTLIRSERPGRTRSEEVGKISKALLQLAKEMNIPVIEIAQLNRDSTKRPGKKPQSSDLRDSGEIEADASCILMVHRDMETEHGKNGLTEILMTKCRHAKVGSCVLQQEGQYSRFANFEGSMPTDDDVEMGRQSYAQRHKGSKNRETF
ncbi:DnaB-like helicase C-terminal domain-containing protein [Pseudomonas monteilii]|uniref:replicative DNA helicase n=1 Tax=Pseudomonas monteilii TaxID=76759 RepID=UPI001E36EA2B|nr:DnaB-like helicase C-terminal domain-containing protein [Pseudomonas monteilii]MCE0981672.1 AAA family ATPase [Pseudomonas monteilii]MDH0023195.1 AAA family ATPase [Pseudomonas monteilii]WJN89807.1 DnaB-like helicase C-terminal domain-containing protein [Pseudomonas monteilii]